MNRGVRTVRCMAAVAVCALAPAAAVAAKLDNAACAALTNERNVIAATGVKADMERGPEWAKANMPPERLQSALRLLEIEDQLEFRCGRRGRPGKPEQTAEPAKPGAGTPPETVKNSAEDKAQDSSKVAEQPSPRVVAAPPAGQRSTSAPPTPAPVTAPPVAQKPAPVVPAPQRTTAAPPGAAPSGPPIVKPVNAPVGTAAVAPAGPTAPATSAVKIPTQPPPVVGANPPVAAPVTEAAPNQQAIAVPIGPTPGGPPPGVIPGAKAPQAAARKKNPRRNPSSAYVPPGDVSPYSLPGMR